MTRLPSKSGILAGGSDVLRYDAEEQVRIERSLQPVTGGSHDPCREDLVHRELYEFADPESLRDIDSREGFRPACDLYCRVLVHLVTKTGTGSMTRLSTSKPNLPFCRAENH